MFGARKYGKHKKKGSWKHAVTISLVGRIILGSIFIYASIDKILHPAAFAEVVYSYHILPGVLVNLTAIILPWMEITLGILLVLGIWLHGAVFLSNLLLLSFFSAIVFNLARGLDIHCGCFSTAETTISYPPMVWYVMRDGILLVLSLCLFLGICLHEPNSNRVKDVSSQIKR